MKPSLFLKLSHPLNRNFVPIKQSLPHFPPPILNCDQSLNLLILDLICKWNHTVFSFVSLLFHLTCCQGLSTLQHISNFIPVYGCIVCHCMYIYMLFIHLLMDMGLFLFFFKKTLVITAAVNIDIQIFESLLSVLLGTYLGVELLDQMVLFTYLRNQKVFFFPLLWNLVAAGRRSLVAASRGCSLVAAHKLLPAVASPVAECGLSTRGA